MSHPTMSTHGCLRLRTTRDDSGVVCVRLQGELDIASQGALRKVLRAIAPAATKQLHLNLAELSFCDSSGLISLLALHKRASAAGVTVCMHGAPSMLRRVVDLIRPETAPIFV